MRERAGGWGRGQIKVGGERTFCLELKSICPQKSQRKISGCINQRAEAWTAMARMKVGWKDVSSEGGMREDEELLMTKLCSHACLFFLKKGGGAHRDGR